MRQRSDRRQGRARLVWGLAVGLIVGGVVAPAAAVRDEKDDRLRVIERLPIDPPADMEIGRSAAGTLYLNPTARHGYQIFPLKSLQTAIRTYDLDTLEPIGEFTIPVVVAQTGGRSTPADYVVAVDVERDRLYMPYETGQSWVGIVMVDPIHREFKLFSKDDAIDPLRAVDPERRSVCTSQACQPQVPGISPSPPLAMDYVDPYLTGLQPKLLIVVQEPNAPGGETNNNIPWLLQWDADTGRQDYFYRIQACTSKNFPTTNNSNYSLTVFQARVGSGIYMGCDIAGGTGQVVRLNVDATNRPIGEETFPGPTNVADVLADPDDDRVLMRVVNEEGESYWVFNGSASSYSGVVGITLSPASTGVGVDLTNGRLYVMTPPTSKGGQESPGGLMMSDVRRNPAPQGLLFPQFAQPGFYKIAVDPFAPGGTRRLFFRGVGARAGEYLVIQDDVPITTDPPLTDLDRFTVDVKEKPGVTAANFTATGHAYGFRYNFVGGLEGLPPGGPNVSGIRVGRAAPRWLGSPCTSSDRRLTLGFARQAQFSNNIMAAASTAGEVDPGTQTDAGEPTARCYPHPRNLPGGISDPFFPIFGNDYPRPLDRNSDAKDAGESRERDARTDPDELGGNDWPFGVSECASEGDRHTETTVKPADRDVDVADPTVEPEQSVPREVREQEHDLQGFAADVQCRAAKGFVRSQARARAFEQKGSPVGDVHIGDVAGDVYLYLDEARGLVARSEAYVRDIRIGGEIFIDAAVTIAEAWAAGRPGTASTSFLRRLCGVRMPNVKYEADVVDLDLPPQHFPDPVGDVDPLDENTDDVIVNGIDVEGCGDAVVPPPSNPTGIGSQPAVDVMNRVLGSRGRVSVPHPDGELRQGTAGGYLASIQKDRLQQVSARSVNNDESTQVPALEIILFNDDPTLGRGRQLYQLAGVDASVTYGIYLLNPASEDFNLPEEAIGLTGGAPPFPGKGPSDQPTGFGQAPPGGGGPITIVFRGIAFLLRSPKDMLLAAAVWAILFSPAQLSWRRRALKGLA